MHKAVLSLGSNIDPGKNIPEARRRLREIVRVLGESTFVRTRAIMPEGVGELREESIHDFVNGAVLIETEMTQGELEFALKKLEQDMGRVKTGDKYAPRTMDIDVVVWNKRIVDPDVRKRDYLKRAVLEIWPEVMQEP